MLPSSLERLAYFSDETSVAFAWKWRRGREGRLRILRSETRSARGPDDTLNVQTCVFDGSGQTLVVDHDVLSPADLPLQHLRRGWQGSLVRSDLPAGPHRRARGSSGDRGHLRRSAPAGSPQAKALLRSRPFSTESVTTNEIAGAVTNLIFSAASVFAAAKPSDGWEEIR